MTVHSFNMKTSCIPRTMTLHSSLRAGYHHRKPWRSQHFHSLVDNNYTMTLSLLSRIKLPYPIQYHSSMRTCRFLPGRSFSTMKGAHHHDAKPSAKRTRRKRHVFRTSEIPSFHDFQQQTQIRSLYRKFLRLCPTDSSQLKTQIEREFRVTVTESWQIKRALSEGTRRYKELSTMLSTTTTTRSSTTTATPSSTPKPAATVWPWQRSDNSARPRLAPFPPKSQPGSSKK